MGRPGLAQKREGEGQARPDPRVSVRVCVCWCLCGCVVVGVVMTLIIKISKKSDFLQKNKYFKTKNQQNVFTHCVIISLQKFQKV